MADTGWAIYVLQRVIQKIKYILFLRIKSTPSSDYFLKFENMKVESRVIVDDYATVNITVTLYSPLVTSQELVLLKYINGIIILIK